MLGEVRARWLWLGGTCAAVVLPHCGGESQSAKTVPPAAGRGGSAGTGAAPNSGSGGGGESPNGGGEAGGGGVGGKGGSGGKAGKGGTGGEGPRGGTAGGGTGGDAGAADAGEGAAGSTEPGVAIAKVAAYQGVEVTLMTGGSAPVPNASIVQSRDTLVRVFLTPDPGWTGGDVITELTVDDGTTTTTEEVTLTLSAASTPEGLATTANFELDGTRITAATTLSFAVSASGRALTRWPVGNAHALAAEDPRGEFEVVMVPLIASGYAPDLSPDTLRLYRTLMQGMYPVPNVTLTVREEVVLPFPVLPDGTGWDEALDQLYTVRAADDPAPNVYYYGVLAPADSMDDFCVDGCIVGLSVVAGPNEEEYRGSIGTGFFDNRTDTFSPETMAHELGHALGRDHSSCGTGGDNDPRYPYAGGMIGTWGFDGRNLRDPALDTDVMGYCVPVWISDYTFDHLFTRIAYVNGQAPRRIPSTESARSPGARVRTLTLRPDGTLGWGSEKSPRGGTGGTPTPVELLAADGSVLAVVNAPLARFDHLPGGFISVPTSALATPGLATLRVDGRSIARPR